MPILQQFFQKGFVINEGVAVDARLVQSASHPISNEEIKKDQEKRETPEGKLDKNGKPLKFSRDMESDWTIKNEKPHYGFKEHAGVDSNHGFVLATELTQASVSDSVYLPYVVAASCHTEEPIDKESFAQLGFTSSPSIGHFRGGSRTNFVERMILKNRTGESRRITMRLLHNLTNPSPSSYRQKPVSSVIGHFLDSGSSPE